METSDRWGFCLISSSSWTLSRVNVWPTRDLSSRLSSAGDKWLIICWVVCSLIKVFPFLIQIQSKICLQNFFCQWHVLLKIAYPTKQIMECVVHWTPLYWMRFEGNVQISESVWPHLHKKSNCSQKLHELSCLPGNYMNKTWCIIT